MAVFNVESKSRSGIDKKPRVYFTCHPGDFEPFFKTVCDLIFKTHDCAIYYTDDMGSEISDEDIETKLDRSNLFVIPITKKLLTTQNRAMDSDIPYALKNHIPVLPIMTENGIDEFYSAPDKFDKLQYLKLYGADSTEIAFEQKLKKYLESVLISDELAERIRSAFDAYIFLSYRKKDRKYANRLMRLIHSYPECRDIAVWFDEFLTPGEDFKENIERILGRCKLFALLVTPRTVEKVKDEKGNIKDNFVMGVELPAARQMNGGKGMDIFAAKMKSINEEEKSELLHNGISELFDVNEADSFKDCFLQTVQSVGITESTKKAEHNFLIGLAYMDGIDVEVDRERGVKLISSAAESNVPEAISKLVEMYLSGDGVAYDIANAIIWQNRLITVLERRFKKSNSTSDLCELFWARYDCAELYCEVHEYTNAETKLKRIVPRLLERKSHNGGSTVQSSDVMNCILCAYLLLGKIHIAEGELLQCEQLLGEAQRLYLNTLIPAGEENGGRSAIETVVSGFVLIYLELAELNKELGNSANSIANARDALRLIKLYLPETSEHYGWDMEAKGNELAGDVLFAEDDLEKAESYYKAMHSIAENNAMSGEDPYALRTLAFSCNRLGDVMIRSGELKEAKDYIARSFEISSGMKHQSLEDEGNIAFCYSRFGDICRLSARPLSCRAYYKKAYKIRRCIYERCKDIDSAMHLAYSCINLARVSLSGKKKYYSEATRLFEYLIAKSGRPNHFREQMEALCEMK